MTTTISDKTKKTGNNRTIKTRAVNLSSISFLIFLLILPIFGKGIDYQESILFYGIPIFLGLLLIGKLKSRVFPPVKPQLLIISLYLVTVFFSRNIGSSYYQFMTFLAVLLIFNLSSVYLPSDKLLNTGIIFSSVFYSVIFIIYKFFLPGLFPTEFTDNVFVQSWGHSYIADFLIFSVPLLLSQLNSQKVTSTLLLLTPITIAVVLSNSRSSIVALIIGLLFIKTKHFYQNVLKIIAFICLLLSLFYIFFFSNHLKSPNGSRPEYWSQAISGFISSPLVGVGPGNFGIINRQYRQSITNTSNYAHNSLLESLSGQGIFFTIFAFSLIGLGLKYQFHHHHLFFILGLMSLINSFLDPSWSAPGILVITLIIIFWKVNLAPTSKTFIYILMTITALFLFSKTSSDILYSKGNYQLSLKFDPFNPSALFQLVDTRQSQIRKFYRQDPYFLNLLCDLKYLPQNEAYFYESIRLDPKGSTNQIIRLIYYYSINNNYSKLDKVIAILDSQIKPVDLPFNLALEVAKSAYKLGLYEWSQKDYQKAIYHFEKAVVYSRNWSHFQLELATALWQNRQLENAKNILSNCQNYPASAAHCREFEKEIDKRGWPTLGHYSQTISSLQVPKAADSLTQP